MVPSFGQNAAIQTYIDIFCLRDAFKVYNIDESKEIIQKILKLIPTNSFEKNKSLMSHLISDFQKSMNPYIAVLQQTPPPSSITVSFLNLASNGSTEADKKLEKTNF